MKKEYIFVGIGIIFLISFLAWGVNRQMYTCGDGVCHQKKEFDTGICPQDCGIKTQAIPDVADSGQSEACEVVSVEKIADGSFPKFSPDGKLIAFNQINEDRIFDIYTIKPDGTEKTCLTCNKEALPKKAHKGQPFWHPSGDYIVFTTQNPDYEPVGLGFSNQPDIGRSHNVWIMTADGENFWQMTDYAENWGVIKPTFSRNGKMIFWNEEFSMEKYPKGKWTDIIPHPGSFWNWRNLVFRKGEELGAWRPVYADFSTNNGEPTISNIRKVDPPENFTALEISGFTADDNGFLYSYDNLIRSRGKDFWGEIYTSDLQGNNLKQLTFSVYSHDENAEYSSGGQKIAWSSSPGDPGQGGVDLYLMDVNGENKAQLTHFGEENNPDYLGDDYSCREIGWSPDGTRIAVSFGSEILPYKDDFSYFFDHLYLLTFEGACGKLESRWKTQKSAYPEKFST